MKENKVRDYLLNNGFEDDIRSYSKHIKTENGFDCINVEVLRAGIKVTIILKDEDLCIIDVLEPESIFKPSEDEAIDFLNSFNFIQKPTANISYLI